MNLEHQDWDTIYIKVNHIIERKDKDKPKKEQSIGNKETKMEQKIEEGNLKIKQDKLYDDIYIKEST